MFYSYSLIISDFDCLPKKLYKTQCKSMGINFITMINIIDCVVIYGTLKLVDLFTLLINVNAIECSNLRNYICIS